MSHFLQLFAEKFTKTPRHGSFLEKLQVLAKSMIFRAFSRNEPLFATFSWKVDQNAETWLFPRKVASFGQMDDFSAESESFREKARKIIDLAKTTTSRANYHAWAFWWTFQQKVANSGSFLEKERKIIDLAKTCNFSRKQPCFGVLVNFSAKSSSFRENARRIIDFAKSCNFSRKLPCFGILVNFSGKSCKKWLISSRSTENHRFPQNLQLFDQTTMFRRFGHFFRKKLQKRAHFVKKHEKSSIWPKLATLRGNYHVSAFSSTFQQKVGKSGSFREKERKFIDFAKSCNFSSKLPCFRVLVNFSAKRWKKWLISWKMTKNHRFGLNLQLFQETTMFRRFCRLFSKKLQKVGHFVKEHKNHRFGQN